MTKTTSCHIKTAVMSDYRFNKSFHLVASEVLNADVMVANDKKSVEIEVKISKQDLLADFKKSKHKKYANVDNHYFDTIPNQFYFCVPFELVDDALKLVKDLPYGVMKYDSSQSVCVIKRAKFMHKEKPSQNLCRIIMLRMGSELVNHKLDKLNIKSKKEDKFI
tara:strand:- start:59 stop:550 length:492 start_codon:yes stop_codon:yes gene_type:complete